MSFLLSVEIVEAVVGSLAGQLSCGASSAQKEMSRLFKDLRQVSHPNVFPTRETYSSRFPCA